MRNSKGHWEHEVFSGLPPKRSQISEALSAGGPLVCQAGRRVLEKESRPQVLFFLLSRSTGKSAPVRSPAAAHTMHADIIMMAQKTAAVQREESSLTGRRKLLAWTNMASFRHMDLEDFMNVTVCKRRVKNLYLWSIEQCKGDLLSMAAR